MITAYNLRNLKPKKTSRFKPPIEQSKTINKDEILSFDVLGQSKSIFNKDHETIKVMECFDEICVESIDNTGNPSVITIVYPEEIKYNEDSASEDEELSGLCIYIYIYIYITHAFILLVVVVNNTNEQQKRKKKMK